MTNQNRGRRAKTLATLMGAMLVASVGLSASPANAHESSYCGHGDDGILEHTVFMSQETKPNPQRPGVISHYHYYAHWRLSGTGRYIWEHNDTKICHMH